nr:lytic transglycosylase domain-containing protein [uncultured Desulfobulbus sp.]
MFHDAAHLGRVYSVIELTDWKYPWASWLNRERIQEEKKRITTLLSALAAGHPPRNKEERRIAALFTRLPSTALRQAQETLRMQLGQKDRFMQGVQRSTRYMNSFRQIFSRYGLPQELAYLPHVESSFTSTAHSKAGAAGLWQFTQSTGQQYLMINDRVDERYDPLRATEAAAQFLKENYNVLGSWPLALTAYNYGRAGMVRAKQKHGSYAKIFTHYDQGYFKFAARNFYSEFLAALRVAKQLEKNIPLSPAIRLPEPGYRLTMPTTLKEMLFHTGLSKAIFLQVNPALRKPVVSELLPAPAGYKVRTVPSTSQKKAHIAPAPNRPVPHIKHQNPNRHKAHLQKSTLAQ